MSMNSKVALITGATSGIGLQTAVDLARLSFDIYITGRDSKRAESALEQINQVRPDAGKGYFIADFASRKSIEQATQNINDRISHIDVLVNNAGAAFGKKEMTEEGIEKTFAVNHLGPFIFTHALLPILLTNAKARIVNVASAAHYAANLRIDDVSNPVRYHPLKAYATSKLANILFTYKLSQKLQGRNISVNCLHPGVVKTRIGNKHTGILSGLAWSVFANFKGVSVEQGASASVFLASSKRAVEYNGMYFHRSEPRKSSALSYNADLQNALWHLSEDLTGIKQYL